MIHKQNRNRIISVCMVCCLLVCGFRYLMRLTERKGGRDMTQELYDKGEEYDVLFVGSSHMIMGVSPMQLWHEQGIPSYNMGRWGQWLPQNYYALEDALAYAHPKLVVIDMLYFGEDRIGYTNDTAWNSSVHEVFDTIPLSVDKIRAIQELYPEDEKQREGFLFKYSYYHNRWEELTEGDFARQSGYGVQKGGSLDARVVQPQSYERITADRMPEERTLGETYVNRMVDLCGEKGIPVLLVYIPHPATEAHQMGANAVYRYAQEKGVLYLNFLDLDVVDFQTDQMDEDSHLNALGARKVTTYLGNVIRTYYQLEDKRADPAYADWNQAYQEFYQFKVDMLDAQTELKSYLMLCNDSDFMVKVVARPGLALLEDPTIQKLLDGVDSVVVTDADLGTNVGVYIQVENRETGEVVSCKNFADMVSVPEAEVYKNE